MRKFLISILLVIFSITASGQMMLPGVVASSIQTSTLNNGLYGYWKFESNAEDSFASYDGTATNVTYATGKSGYDASFNGSTSKVDVSGAGVQNGSFAISFWAKTASTTLNMRVVSCESWSTAATGYYVAFTGGQIRFALGDNVAGVEKYSGTGLADGTWKHIICVWDNPNTDMLMYINGSAYGGATDWASDVYYNGSEILRFGWSGGGGYLNGEVDEVRIYNRTLTIDEIYELYHEFD